MLADLGGREINELHVEAGAKLNASLLEVGLVDELLVYLAPRLIGRAAPSLRSPRSRPRPALGFLQSVDFRIVDVTRLGDDLRLRLRPLR